MNNVWINMSVTSNGTVAERRTFRSFHGISHTPYRLPIVIQWENTSMLRDRSACGIRLGLASLLTTAWRKPATI